MTESMDSQDIATTQEERDTSMDRFVLWLGSEVDRLAVELRRTEHDLAVAVQEARRARDIVDAKVPALTDELDRLMRDYSTLWGMTLGHDGQPPTGGTPDDVERLRARLTEPEGTESQ